jgi:hypothetical protein
MAPAQLLAHEILTQLIELQRNTKPFRSTIEVEVHGRILSVDVH